VVDQGEERMNESERIVDGARKPTLADVAAWVGRRDFARWTDLTQFIEASYPGVFRPEWLFGGRKHGWSLRFKKSKSFCTLIPERGRFRLLLVFGAAERKKVKGVLRTLVSHVREDYVKSATYHDGKWMFVSVDSAKALSDVKRLLVVKRTPRPA
jgi:hypothetical protein